jgi:predicted fused transcriptional regulator/phosphomethylpyrimidine kinase
MKPVFPIDSVFLTSLHTASYIIDLRKLCVNVCKCTSLTRFAHILENCANNGYKAVSYARVELMQAASQNKILTTYTYHAP